MHRGAAIRQRGGQVKPRLEGCNQGKTPIVLTLIKTISGSEKRVGTNLVYSAAVCLLSPLSPAAQTKRMSFFFPCNSLFFCSFCMEAKSFFSFQYPQLCQSAL